MRMRMLEDVGDEVWRIIMEIGVKSSTLTYKDLCSLAISSKQLNLLSSENPLWSSLLYADFPLSQDEYSSSPSSSKSLYQSWYVEEKAQSLEAHRRLLARLLAHEIAEFRVPRDEMFMLVVARHRFVVDSIKSHFKMELKQQSMKLDNIHIKPRKRQRSGEDGLEGIGDDNAEAKAAKNT